MKVNPSIRELRKSLCWVPSSLTSSKKQSVYWCFDFLCTQHDLSEAYHWGTAPFTQVKVFCLLSSGVPYHWPAAFSNGLVCILCLLAKAYHVSPSFVKDLPHTSSTQVHKKIQTYLCEYFSWTSVKTAWNRFMQKALHSSSQTKGL